MGRWNEDTTGIPMAFIKGQRSGGQVTQHVGMLCYLEFLCVYILLGKRWLQLEESCWR